MANKGRIREPYCARSRPMPIHEEMPTPLGWVPPSTLALSMIGVGEHDPELLSSGNKNEELQRKRLSNLISNFLNSKIAIPLLGLLKPTLISTITQLKWRKKYV